MKLKNLMMSLAFGVLLSACGAPLPEETESTEQEFGTTSQALCEGWDNGGRYCTFRCTSTQTNHYFAGYGDVPYGNCREYADRYCGRTAYSVCWSKL
jgi:pectin methylesterase-like acyl-CoA thioesterase